MNYARDGWQVGIIARRKEKLEQLKSKLVKSYHANVLVAACDVSDKKAIFSAIEHMIQVFGRIDSIIANAGVGYSTPGYETNIEHFEKTININVLGAGYTAYAAIPTMVKQKTGQIVVISSLAGYRGLPEAGAYCASKSAVNALFESMRLDLKKFNIGVTIIRPGYIESGITARNDYFMPQLQSTKKGVEKIYRAIQKKKKIHVFPKPLGSIVQSFYFWPSWLYDFVFAGLQKKKRDH